MRTRVLSVYNNFICGNKKKQDCSEKDAYFPIDSEKKKDFTRSETETIELTAESVQSPTLPLESVDNVHGRDCFAASVLCVRNRVTNHVL